MHAIFMMYGVSFVLISAMMILLWIYYLVRHNAGIVDMGWCTGFLMIGITFFILGQGWLPRKIVLAGMILFWASQLLCYIFRKYRTSEPDPRYVEMIEGWGGEGKNVKVLLMFLFQGFLLLIISVAFIFPFMNGREEWHYFEAIGLTLWAIGVIGEMIANKQLIDFKNQPENKGKICQKGLWNLSRHPNYFFEFVVWMGFGAFACGSSFGFLGLISPMIILYLLLNVSGVPLAEKQALKSKGSAYRDYQASTSVFIPWFKRIAK